MLARTFPLADKSPGGTIVSTGTLFWRRLAPPRQQHHASCVGLSVKRHHSRMRARGANCAFASRYPSLRRACWIMPTSARRGQPRQAAAWRNGGSIGAGDITQIRKGTCAAQYMYTAVLPHQDTVEWSARQRQRLSRPKRQQTGAHRGPAPVANGAECVVST